VKRVPPDDALLAAALAAISPELEMKVLTAENWLRPDYPVSPIIGLVMGVCP
jgi:hypothetical protein